MYCTYKNTDMVCLAPVVGRVLTEMSNGGSSQSVYGVKKMALFCLWSRNKQIAASASNIKCFLNKKKTPKSNLFGSSFWRLHQYFGCSL